MIFTSLLLLLATSAHGQTVYDAAHNVTVITGTWSSGSQNVVTGPVSRLFHSITVYFLTQVAAVSRTLLRPLKRRSHTQRQQECHILCEYQSCSQLRFLT
jgi:hypothetical protein